MRFLERIDPRNIPPSISPDEPNQVMQEKILQWVLLVTIPIGYLVFASGMFRDLQNGHWGVLAIYGTALLLTTSMAVFRTIPLPVRSLFIVIALFTIGLAELLISGASGSGRLIFIAFITLSGILFGFQRLTRRGKIIYLFFVLVLPNSILWLVSAVLTSSRFLSDNAGNITSPGSLLHWASGNVVFLLVSALVFVVNQILIDRLVAADIKQRESLQRLSQQSEIIERTFEDQAVLLKNQKNQFEAAGRIITEISKSTNLDQVFSNSINSIQREFDVYYAGIYLLDENKRVAILRAASETSGKAMLERSHRIPIGEIGPVGLAMSQGEPIIVFDAARDHYFQKNPYLPLTQSEIVLPLKIQSKLIGALDIQSKNPNAFLQEDISIFQLIADQLTSATDKTIQLTNLQESVTYLETVYSQATLSTWKKYLDQQPGMYAYRYKNHKVENIQIHIPEATEAMRTGIKVIHTPSDESNPEFQNSTVSIPIKIQNQVLGALNVQVNRENISQDLLNLLDQFSNRLGLALEKAQLMEEIQTKANQEHLVSQISSKLRSSSDVSSILETAAVELGKNMEFSEVVIQLVGKQS